MTPEAVRVPMILETEPEPRGLGVLTVLREASRIALPLARVEIRARVAERVAEVTLLETFHGAQRIHGGLKCAFRIRRTPRFVVDHAQAVAGQQIDAVGNTLERNTAPAGRSEGEFAVEPMFEPPLADRRGP